MVWYFEKMNIESEGKKQEVKDMKSLKILRQDP